MTTDMTSASPFIFEIGDAKRSVRQSVRLLAEQRLLIRRPPAEGIETNMAFGQIHFASNQPMRPVYVDNVISTEHRDNPFVTGSSDQNDATLRPCLQGLLCQSPLSREGLACRGTFNSYGRTLARGSHILIRLCLKRLHSLV